MWLIEIRSPLTNSSIARAHLRKISDEVVAVVVVVNCTLHAMNATTLKYETITFDRHVCVWLTMFHMAIAARRSVLLYIERFTIHCILFIATFLQMKCKSQQTDIRSEKKKKLHDKTTDNELNTMREEKKTNTSDMVYSQPNGWSEFLVRVFQTLSTWQMFSTRPNDQ